MSARSRKYYQIRLGENGKYAGEAYKGDFVGVDSIKSMDLSGFLSLNKNAFIEKLIDACVAEALAGRNDPEQEPELRKKARSSHLPMMHQVCVEMEVGDIVLCPDGLTSFVIGEVCGDYCFSEGQNLPQRRKVRWLTLPISRDMIDVEMQSSFFFRKTIGEIGKHKERIETLIEEHRAKPGESSKYFGNPFFESEQSLCGHLCKQLGRTALAEDYGIDPKESWRIERDHLISGGKIDVLATHGELRKTLAIVANKGMATPSSLGQLLGHIAYLKSKQGGEKFDIQGCIVALDAHPRLVGALALTPWVKCYRYCVGPPLVLERVETG